MNTITRSVWSLLSGLAGVALCIAVVKLDEQLRVLPRPTNEGGESDAALRAGAFFFMVCPVFLALGARLGWLGAKGPARVLRGWAGLLGGTVLAFGCARLLAPVLLASWAQPNAGFVGFLVAWVLLGAAGAELALRTRSPAA